MITIKNTELIEKVKTAITEEVEENFNVIGIRFEDKLRKIGNIVTECSKDNSEREDERDFPEYGSPEYDELEELDGISTWDINFWEWGNLSGYSDKTSFESQHIYLMGGEIHSFGPDDHELNIEDAEVIAILA